MAHPAAPDLPVWHLAPPRGWMNDPNGLCRVDDRWHAFYQHHPASDVWGPMHWGHASSVDLVHWQHHPVALAPDEHGTIFSGSVVRDHDNTAGFGAGALVALFTHHAGEVQHQSVAFSVDGGEAWHTFAHNPVLPGSDADFRDPKVRRLPGGGWSMVVACRDHLQFFESADLLHWARTGEFSADVSAVCGRPPGAWECPDVVELARDGGGTAWLLVVSVAEGGPQGRSGTLAVPGEPADGGFVAQGDPFRLDHGPDFYAFQSFWGTPRGDAIGMAWMASWDDALVVPSDGWRGVQSLPRRLRYSRDGLRQWPAALPAGAERGAAWRQAEGDLVVSVEGSAGEDLHDVGVRAGVRDGSAFVERWGGSTPTYDGRYEQPVHSPGPTLVVVDHGTVEVFAGGGVCTLSARLFAGRDPRVTFS